MKSSPREDLKEEDVRSIVRLIGGIAVLDTDLAGKKRRLMSGLCELIEASCWAWVLLSPKEKGKNLGAVGILHGGFSEEQYSAYLQAQEHPDMIRYNELFFNELVEKKGPLTRLRQQLDPENTFENSAVFQLWREADISPLILSCYPFPDGCSSMIALYRPEHAPLFSERDARIAHIVLSEIPWVHAQSWPQVKGIRGQMLAPRVRLTLNYLLEGLGRKQIAAELNITENTVSGYIKLVYRFYNVRSHAELMKRFQTGDGGDL